MDSSNPADLFMPLCLIMWSFVAMFFNCEMGQNVSNQFNKLGDEIYKCDWYLFPHKLQRMLVIIMINAQEPVSIRGFGNVVCTRDSFKQVWFSVEILIHSNFMEPKFHFRLLMLVSRILWCFIKWTNKVTLSKKDTNWSPLSFKPIFDYSFIKKRRK